MKAPDEMDLPPEARQDLALLKQFGGGRYDVEAGLRAFEERIASPPPSSGRLPRTLLLCALAVCGVASVAVVASHREVAPPPAMPIVIASAPAVTQTEVPPPAPAPTLTSVSIDTLPTVATSTAHPSAPVSAPAPTPTVDAPDLVDAEVRQAATVRSAARTDPAEALALAAEGDRQFPKGLLHAEREAIAIEALARLGRTSEAKTRGEAFANAYPSHPRTGRIRAIVSGERPWEQ